MDSFEVVRRWFVALNREDLDGLVSLYHEDCVNDQGAHSQQGREAQREFYRRTFVETRGAFAGGVRRKVRRKHSGTKTLRFSGWAVIHMRSLIKRRGGLTMQRRGSRRGSG